MLCAARFQVHVPPEPARSTTEVPFGESLRTHVNPVVALPSSATAISSPGPIATRDPMFVVKYLHRSSSPHGEARVRSFGRGTVSRGHLVG